MNRYRGKGTITVFLSLVSVLILSLLCTLAESARIQGARAWAAAVTDMGLFSVFSEYEAEILEKYDVFFLDGAYGTGDFQAERLSLRMKEFMEYNITPQKGLDLTKGINLFPMTIQGCEVTGYTLATDGGGMAFYHQAVQSIQDNLVGELLLKVQESQKEGRKQQEAAKEYERQEDQNQRNLKELEEQRQIQDTAKSKTEEGKEAEVQEPKPIENPLDAIGQIKKMGILDLVVKDPAQISTKKVVLSGMPSKRKLREGTLSVKERENNLLTDGIFQDYLLEHFGNMREPDENGGLSYPLEYLLTGKESDVENLKGVVHRLLLMREGTNFLYAWSNAEMRNQANTLALAIAGAAVLPGLAAALELALLLAWAYGESLLDVRILLSGGKVPLTKDAESWKLSLQNLGNLSEVLSECEQDSGKGQNYVDYLRILLAVGGKDSYPLRALDMIESGEAGGIIKADDWIVRAEVCTEFQLSELFMQVTRAFLEVENQGLCYKVSGQFGY